MAVELVLLDSRRTIQRKILSAFVYELNKRNSRTKLRARLEYGTKTLIANAILGSPEYISLIGGKLQGHFGITNPQAKIQSLLLQWINEITIQVFSWRVVGPRIVGGFTVNAIKADFNQVTNMEEAQQLTEKGDSLPWLNWLLFSGDNIILRDHYYAFNSRFKIYSRTGQGIMLSKESGINNSGWTTGLASGGWRVPPEYSGTKNNNWITRAICGKGRGQGIRPQVRKLFQQIVRDF